MAVPRFHGDSAPERKKAAKVGASDGTRTAQRQAIEFHLRGEFVELCNLLKLTGIADSGGQGKQMVAEGMVRVDGKPEMRKTAKIRAGQRVDCNGIRVAVLAADR